MDETKSAFGIALKALSRRDHSEAEIRRKLVTRNFSLDTINEVVTGLLDAGYLNDARFARTFAECAIRNGRGYGFRIRVDLLRRGIAEDLIVEALGTLGAEYEESATLAELLARKFPDFDPQGADDRQKRRVLGYFQRRGFSLAAIVRVLRDREGE
jgi:regulatory protein